MAAEEAQCPDCGKPLIGRDRYEGKCSSCREKEILGEDLPAESGGRRGKAAVACPACGASNERGLAACAHCGAALALPSARGVGTWALAAGGALTIGLVLAVLYVALSPPAVRRPAAQPAPRPLPPFTRRPEPPAEEPPVEEPRPVPEEETLRPSQETQELLSLLGRGDYERAIDNYFQPDEADFGRVQRALDAILDGDASKGFADWSARLILLRQDRVIQDLRRAGDPRPDFTAALLADLARDPGASSGHRTSQDRARAVIRWHIASLFGGIDLASAKPGAIREVRPGCFAVALDCQGQRQAAWLRDEPAQMLWTRLSVGWVAKLGLADWLEGAYGILKRSPTP